MMEYLVVPPLVPLMASPVLQMNQQPKLLIVHRTLKRANGTWKSAQETLKSMHDRLKMVHERLKRVHGG